MRLWHVLVLPLCCGCSLDTKPFGDAVADGHASVAEEARLEAVSFGVWRRLSPYLAAGSSGAPQAAAASAPRAGRSAGRDFELSNKPAAFSGEAARGGSGDSPDDLDAGVRTGPDEAGGAGAAASAGAGSEGGAAAPAAGGGGSGEPAGAASAGAAASPPLRAAGAGAGSSAELAGQSGSAGAVAGGAGNASGSAGSAAAEGGSGAAGTGGSGPDAPAEQPGGRSLLRLVQDILSDGFGVLWSPEWLTLSATVSSIVSLSETQLTRPLLANVLTLLASTNVCGIDPVECSELCSALDDDCSVCRWDATCQASVERLCVAQRGFSCDVR